jgi:hypothetical protein
MTPKLQLEYVRHATDVFATPNRLRASIGEVDHAVSETPPVKQLELPAEVVRERAGATGDRRSDERDRTTARSASWRSLR